MNSINIDNFAQDQVVKISLSGSDDTPFEGQDFDFEIDIPDDFPKIPVDCFVNKGIYHINVFQSKKKTLNNRILVNELKNW